MRAKNRAVAQIIGLNLALLLPGTSGLGTARAQAPGTTEQQQTAAAPTSAEQPAAQESGASGAAIQDQPGAGGPEQLPDSPGAVRAQSSPPQPPPSSLRQTPNSTPRPVGTAAAEVGNASGVAASKPAGVAIAPAKQRRVRSFLIKMGAIVGAGVAIGTVVALSQSSPSTPPGAR